jgi:hypothetical protein
MLTSNNESPQLWDRRKDERHLFRSQVRCQVIDPLSEQISRAGPWDVSNGGVCILVATHFRSGTHLEIQFHMPGNDTPVKVFAEVIHTLLVPSFHEMWLTGCSVLAEEQAEKLLQS